MAKVWIDREENYHWFVTVTPRVIPDPGTRFNLREIEIPDEKLEWIERVTAEYGEVTEYLAQQAKAQEAKAD